jgi:hypothetical protein
LDTDAFDQTGLFQTDAMELGLGQEGYDDYIHEKQTWQDDGGWDTDDDCESDSDSDSDSDAEDYDGPASLWGFRTSCLTPAMLLTCRESFGVASKFTAVLSAQKLPFRQFGSTGNEIYCT